MTTRSRKAARPTLAALEGRQLLTGWWPPIPPPAPDTSLEVFLRVEEVNGARHAYYEIDGSDHDDRVRVTDYRPGPNGSARLLLEQYSGGVRLSSRTLDFPVGQAILGDTSVFKAVFFRGKGGDDQFSNATAAGTALHGGPGEDTLAGGTGDDYVAGEDGADYLTGGQGGSNIIYGGDNDDRIYGGPQRDSLYGGGGHDSIYGSLGNDYLSGDAGNDTLDGGDGTDNLWGGPDDDLLKGDSREHVAELNPDSLNGGSGNDTLYGYGGRDALYGDAGHDLIVGGGNNDFIDGGEGDDSLYGGDGDDTLKGGDGKDELLGGLGDDYLDPGYKTGPSIDEPELVFGGYGRDVFVKHWSFFGSDLDDIFVDYTPGSGDTIEEVRHW